MESDKGREYRTAMALAKTREHEIEYMENLKKMERWSARGCHPISWHMGLYN
jgi:hypothetical protein